MTNRYYPHKKDLSVSLLSKNNETGKNIEWTFRSSNKT